MIEVEQQSEWWADEIWRLRSTWSPVGATAFVTFLVDPQNDDHDRQKGVDVWAVAASCRRPLSKNVETALCLGSGWRNDLPTLLDTLDCFRMRPS